MLSYNQIYAKIQDVYYGRSSAAACMNVYEEGGRSNGYY